MRGTAAHSVTLTQLGRFGIANLARAPVFDSSPQPKGRSAISQVTLGVVREEARRCHPRRHVPLRGRLPLLELAFGWRSN